MFLLATILVISSAFLFYFDKRKSDKDMANFKKFANISRLGYYGLEIDPGPGITTNHSLYNKMKDVSEKKDGKVYPKCGILPESIYSSLIKENPDFPFSYYAMSVCKKDRNDPDWIEYAEKALTILNITTSIGNHHEQHDITLKALSKILGNRK